jgi:class 3 adenylate cyclase/CHASE2 domain-containing sensor protein
MLEGTLTDFRMRHGQIFSPKISDDIVHVDIDDDSQREIGRWPWNREQLALALDVLKQAGPRTIVLDLLLDDPQDPRYTPDEVGQIEVIKDDDQLAASIMRAGNVILGVSIEDKEEPDGEGSGPEPGTGAPAEGARPGGTGPERIVRWPIEELRSAIAGFGFVIVGEAQRSIRSLRMAVDVENQRLYQLGVVGTAHFLGDWPDGVSATRDELTIGDRTMSLHDWRALIPWRLRDPKGEAPWVKEGANPWYRIHRRVPMWNFVQLGRAERRLQEVVGILTQQRPLDRWVTSDDLEQAGKAASFLIESFEGEPVEEVLREKEDAAGDYPTPGQFEELRLLRALRDLPTVRENFQIIKDRIEAPETGLRALLKDKLVFVGWTGTGVLADFYPTALDVRTPGVSVHSAIANGILTGQWIDQAPMWLDLLVTIVAGLSATVVASWMSPSRGWIVAVVLTAAYFAFNTVVVFDYGNMLLALGAPLVAAVGSWGTCTTIRAIQERREKAAIRRQFRARVSAQLVDYLTEHPDLVNMEGEERELTIAFTDFVGFTSISEKLEGRATVALLNRYLRAMTEVMLDRSGYVNKFLGDGIMGFWGAPAVDTGHAAKACFAVLECYDALDMLNQAPEYEDLPKLGMRVGISTGKVIVGDCGAPPRLNDYTVIGDAVNLAARLESANKMLGTRAMVTGRTLQLMSEQDRNRILWRPLGKLRVVGQTQLTEVFELVARADDPEVTDEIRKWIDDTTKAVGLFNKGEIAEAQEMFQELVLFERGSAGALLYMERCAELLESKREDYFLPLRSK